MKKRNPDERLERFNVVLSLDDIAWMDQLIAELLATGAKVPFFWVRSLSSLSS